MTQSKPPSVIKLEVSVNTHTTLGDLDRVESIQQTLRHDRNVAMAESSLHTAAAQWLAAMQLALRNSSKHIAVEIHVSL